VPDWMLPPTTFVVPGVALVSLYLTNSGVAFGEHLVANPDTPEDLRSKGIDAVIDRVADEATAADVRMLCTWVSHPHVEERHARRGGRVLAQGMTAMGLML